MHPAAGPQPPAQRPVGPSSSDEHAAHGQRSSFTQNPGLRSSKDVSASDQLVAYPRSSSEPFAYARLKTIVPKCARPARMCSVLRAVAQTFDGTVNARRAVAARPVRSLAVTVAKYCPGGTVLTSTMQLKLLVPVHWA